MVIAASGSALVSGAALGAAAPAAEARIRARKNLTGPAGVRIESGAVATVPAAFARGLLSAGLCDLVPDEPPAEPAEVAQDAPKKGKSYARK